MKKLAYIGTAFATAALPLLASAQEVDSVQDLASFIINFINNVAVPLVFALAFIVFIWGIFQYFILGGSDDKKRAAGKSLMLWGLVGFFLMVSVWGLVHILTGTLDTNNQQPTLPQTDNI